MKTHDDRTTRFGAVEGLSPGQRLASGPGLCSQPSPARPGPASACPGSWAASAPRGASGNAPCCPRTWPGAALLCDTALAALMRIWPGHGPTM